MEKLIQILETAEQKSSTLTHGFSKNRTAAIFSEIKSLYGNKFINLYKSVGEIEKAKKRWEESLIIFSDEVIDKSISLIATKFQWPPNLKEFYELCKSLDKSDFGPKKNVINSNHQDIKVKRIIDEGAEICKRLKIIFPECSWMKISSLFTRLKKFERLLYKELDDLGLILQLQNRDNDYFVEVLEK